MTEGAEEAGSVRPRDASDEDFVKGALAALNMVDGRADRMGESQLPPHEAPERRQRTL
jgi:hypothetical protein